jgi:hypothetical protein
MTRFFKRSLLLVVPAAIAALALTVPAFAGPDGTTSATGVTSPALLSLITNNDLFSTMNLSPVLDPAGTNGTQHYGPYTSTSPDSSTCGNDWANDTFDRHFTVRPNKDGTFDIVEQFKNSSFVTSTGPSPGGCDTNPGGMIVAGKTGSMHGYFTIVLLVPGTTQTSQSPYCDATNSTNADCSTATFISTHFSTAVYDTPTFFFHYSAGDQSLVYHEWKNASTDRGGNSGDIASS